MLNIYVVDLTAESRNLIIGEINDFIQRDLRDNFLIPRLNIKPLAVSEIKFHSAPDICIVGQELVVQELSQLAELRKMLPESAIVVRTRSSLENISIYEQFARLGVDDTFGEGITALEFFRKIILLSKRGKKTKSGQLIVVEGSKGGQGTTSVVAGIADALQEQGKKVLLVDLDSETQDLSRFLLVKPYINENLQYLIDQQRPISEETVMQCVQSVWSDEENLYCMPPIADSDEIYDSRSGHSRIFLSVFDILDRTFDYVIVDLGSVRGNLARTLYRIADTIICLVNNDPAALYACSNKISNLRSNMSVSANLKIMECAANKNALPSSLVRTEISRAAKLENDAWLPQALPFCSNAGKWPGSGNTIYSIGSRALRKALSLNLQDLGYIQPENANSVKRKLLAGKDYIKELVRKEKPAGLPPAREKNLLELPSPVKVAEPANLLPEKIAVNLQTNEEVFGAENEPLVSNVRIN